MSDPNAQSPWADPTRAGVPGPPPPPPPGFAPLDPGYAPYAAPQYQVPAQPTSYGGYPGYGGYGAQPPPAYPHGMFQPMTMPQPSTNGMAIASMVLSIIGALLLLCYIGGLIGLVGAILGHIGRRQVREQHEAGGGMALAGVIIGWISVALEVLYIGFIVYATTVLRY